jgi:undecaprenyl diphosphate synthase
MDGNGRWAKLRGQPRIVGHRQGAEAARRTTLAAAELGIRYLTLFGFSSENWNRPADEVDDLMGLLRHYMQGEIAELHKNGIRVRVVGERARLAPDIIAFIDNAEQLTRNNARLDLAIAFSYGGRADITQAARRVALAVAQGRLSPDDIDEHCFSGHLLTDGIPDPDLLIRTSGEQRISNFLLWQTAYAELVFTATLWPDFGKADLEKAMRDFHGRERRYGATFGAR